MSSLLKKVLTILFPSLSYRDVLYVADCIRLDDKLTDNVQVAITNSIHVYVILGSVNIVIILPTIIVLVQRI